MLNANGNGPSGNRRGGITVRAWAIVAICICGLLIAIGGASVIAMIENERVRDVIDDAISYELEVEDEGDDLRAAVLDVRHYHRDIAFNGPSSNALADFDAAYADLLEEITELERINLTDLTVMSASEIRQIAEQYYEDFWPAIEVYTSDPLAFMRASDEGLRRLERLDRAAKDIDDLGEQMTETTLADINQATSTERFILIALLAGVAVVGVALVISAGSVLTKLAASYAREQSLTQELTRNLRTKADFIGDASHELRTPLTIIQGNAEIGLGANEDGIRQAVLAEIWAESTRMTRLVEDLLFLARSDAGVPPLDKELVSARWIVSQLARPAEVLAQQRETNLRVDMSGEGYLEIDTTRIEQAVLILIDNASKFCDPGSTINLSSRVQDRALLIEVADHGPGIAPDDIPFIFDRFHRVGTRRARKKGGTGLGLSIAKTIVEAHGGTISTSSRVGAGTTMTICLPLCDAPTPVDSPLWRIVPGGALIGGQH